MNRMTWYSVFVVVELSLGPGCRWFHKSEAERHERAAEKAAKELNFGKMIDEGKKAHTEKKAAERAPLP